MTLALSTLPSTCPRFRHILTGTFNSVFLHLLQFDTTTRELSVAASVAAQGPHQYLTLGSIPSASERIVYATTWAEDRRVSAWRVGLHSPRIEYINSQEITATPSYVSMQPPPWNSVTSPAYGVQPDSDAHRYLYQAGGPTGEVFALDDGSGAIGQRKQDLVFLEGGPAALPAADKSRKALRYGAHSFDFDVNGLAYVAHVGRNAVFVYTRDAASGQLSQEPALVIPSPADKDGPRHAVPSPDGKYLFVVTEHTSFVDVFSLNHSGQLSSTHLQRLSIIPPDHSRHDYRGDTLRLSPDGQWLFATTRGMTEKTRGWVKAWRLHSQPEDSRILEESSAVAHRTPTSGGKANALEWAPRYPFEDPQNHHRSANSSAPDWAVLTDDEQGYVVILEWDGKDLKEAARTQLPPNGEGAGGPQGASHAIWLS